MLRRIGVGRARKGSCSPRLATALLTGGWLLAAVGGGSAQEREAVPERAAVSREASGDGRVVGRLADDDTGRPISGAVLALSPGGATTLSDSTGAFALPPVPAGAYRLEIRHIAYGTRTVDVEVRSRRASYLDLRIPPEAVALEPLEVEVEWRPRFLEEVGFYDRRERGWGTFFDPEFVERWSQGVTSLGQFLDRATNQHGTFHDQRIAHEGAPASLCPTGVPIYIDGHLDQQSLFAELSPAEVGAVEVYYDSHGVPGFALADQWPCLGAIAIWTKRWVDRGEPVGGTGDGGPGGARERITVRTDRRGRYRLCDLPSGTAVRLRASYRDHEGAPVEVFETLAGSEAGVGDETSAAAAVGAGHGGPRRSGHDLAVPVAEPGRLVGRILDRDTGRPVASADIVVRGEGASGPSVRRAQTDEGGYFALEGLAPGDHAVSVRHLGFDELWDSVSVMPVRTSELRAELSPRPLDLERSRADRNSVDELVSPADVAAVEVYPGATSLPGEFAGSRGRCGALVVWTR